MRTKNFIFLLVLVILLSILLIVFGPSNNENIANIQNLANQQIRNIKVRPSKRRRTDDFRELKKTLKLKENLRVERKEKELDVDPKYLQLLGFHVDFTSASTTRGSTHIYNITRQNFSIVSYVLQNELAAAILQLQNLASVLPTENLLIYDLGLSDVDLQTLSAFCNTSTTNKCIILRIDLNKYPSYIMDDKLHLFRPILIKHALTRYHTVLFMSNKVRLRAGTSKILAEIRKLTEEKNHVTSLEIKKLPITSNTHPRMFDYFDSDADSFLFVRQVTLDAVFFHQNRFLDEKILLPWLKCVLTPQCVIPIGTSNSNHCRFNKKPQYRYSGCHDYDESAFNVICGLTFSFNEAKYAYTDGPDGPLFSKESLEDSIRILDNRKRNISETSEHPYSEE